MDLLRAFCSSGSCGRHRASAEAHPGGDGGHVADHTAPARGTIFEHLNLRPSVVDDGELQFLPTVNGRHPPPRGSSAPRQGGVANRGARQQDLYTSADILDYPSQSSMPGPSMSSWAGPPGGIYGGAFGGSFSDVRSSNEPPRDPVVHKAAAASSTACALPRSGSSLEPAASGGGSANAAPSTTATSKRFGFATDRCMPSGMARPSTARHSSRHGSYDAAPSSVGVPSQTSNSRRALSTPA